MTLFETIKTALLRGYVKRKSRGRLPQLEGKLDLKGLKAPVEIKRDAQGVPHIFAGNRHDLFFAQGFVHAQDRLWQMEINRMISCGRLSERFGEGALPTDRLSRTLGFYRQARHDFELISEELRTILHDYAAGINAFLAHPDAQLPVEFALLKYEPEPFTALETIAFSRLMTFQLSNGWGHELAREQLLRVLGPEIAAEFDIRTHPETPYTIPKGIERHFRQQDGRLEAMDGPFLNPMGGSNAWVVEGARTDTGAPILANDPHLSALMPSVWYQVYLGCPDFRVQGVSIPGIPMVMIGHNEHIAWGLTMAFTDIQDIFIEEFVDETRYRQGGKAVEAETVEEVIHVKDGPDTLERVVITRNGPVVSGHVEAPDLDHPQRVYALKSPALETSRFTMGWFLIDTAKDWDGFLEGMRQIEAPGLNVVFADRKGNIGYWVTGQTPVRKQGRGEVPRPGWTGEFDWVGTVPFAEMPHNFNPERGWIVSANHKIVGPDYPHFLGSIWMNGYRAQRIEDLLFSDPDRQLSLADMGPVQMDLMCRPGQIFADLYRGWEGKWSRQALAARQYLLEWDGQLTRETVGGTVYEYTRKALVRLLLEPWDDQEHLFGQLVGKGPHAVMFRVAEFQGRETNALFDLLENPQSKVLEAVGGRKAVLEKALEEAVAAMEQDMGKRMEHWQWGRIHQLEFRHALAVKPILGRIFNVGPVAIGGDTDTVCQTSMQPEEGYRANLASPSYRQVIDLSDFNRSTWIMPPGQCGHYGSPHREDQLHAWLEGESFPMLWDPEAIDSATRFHLKLSPGND